MGTGSNTTLGNIPFYSVKNWRNQSETKRIKKIFGDLV